MRNEGDRGVVTGITLDSWAILAWVQGEKPGSIIRDLMAWCEGNSMAARVVSSWLGGTQDPPTLYLSLVNLGEIYYVLGRRQGERAAEDLVDQLRLSPLRMVPVTEQIVIKAAKCKMRYPVAYADAFAVATAEVTKSALLTGDPELRGITNIKLLWIGQE